MGAVMRAAMRWGGATLDFLADVFGLPGTNGLGLALFVVAFAPSIVAQVYCPAIAVGAVTAAGGVTSFGLDIGLRWLLRHESLLDRDRGGRFVYLPLWVWGLVWVLLGAIQYLAATWGR